MVHEEKGQEGSPCFYFQKVLPNTYRHTWKARTDNLPPYFKRPLVNATQLPTPPELP